VSGRDGDHMREDPQMRMSTLSLRANGSPSEAEVVYEPHDDDYGERGYGVTNPESVVGERV
jgi:hypothetical protein